MDSAPATIIETVIAGLIVIACLALSGLNVYAMHRCKNKSYRVFWIAQCIPLLYGSYIMAQACITGNKLIPLHVRSVLLLIVVAGLMERIAHTRE
jgi:hypothetical protein